MRLMILAEVGERSSHLSPLVLGPNSNQEKVEGCRPAISEGASGTARYRPSLSFFELRLRPALVVLDKTSIRCLSL